MKLKHERKKQRPLSKIQNIALWDINVRGYAKNIRIIICITKFFFRLYLFNLLIPLKLIHNFFSILGQLYSIQKVNKNE